MDGGGFDGYGARPLTAASLAEAAWRREAEADAASALAGLLSLRRRLEEAPAARRAALAGLAETLSRVDAALAEAVRALHSTPPSTGRDRD